LQEKDRAPFGVLSFRCVSGVITQRVPVAAVWDISSR
jgi:hypothetical protein